MEDYYTNPSDFASVGRFTEQAPHQQVPHQQVPHQQVPLQQVPHQQVPVATLAQRPRVPQFRYSQDTFSINFKDILKRVVKYLVEGLAVAFVAYYFIGKHKLDMKDIVMLGITAAFVFAILDTFSPTISLGARFGAGFGIGQGLFGVGPAAAGALVA